LKRKYFLHLKQLFDALLASNKKKQFKASNNYCILTFSSTAWGKASTQGNKSEPNPNVPSRKLKFKIIFFDLNQTKISDFKER
jgi:hypothetical protein